MLFKKSRSDFAHVGTTYKCAFPHNRKIGKARCYGKISHNQRKGLTMNSKLEQLKKKQEQLRLHIQKEEQKLKTKNRKDDTRRKILVGAMVLDRMDKNDEYKQEILSILDSYLKNEKDRSLFHLK